MNGLRELLDGNDRFISGQRRSPQATAERTELALGQKPFAAILGCSDSRVPVETVFDRNPGEMFVVRVAGNFVDDAGLGSLEYAVAVLRSSLIMVLGHLGCGAVSAATEYVQTGTKLPGHIAHVVEAVVPAATATRAQTGDWIENAVLENVRQSLKALTSRSAILAEAERNGTLTIVGAVYDLHTGKVHVIT